MIFRVNMKTPDALSYAVENLLEDEQEDAMAFAEEWMGYDGETITLEFDTKDGTCVVLKDGER